uniref:Glycosyltransferase n=1 Tax=Glycyrrhiza uralensis TaxID=74613 RepID=A0A5A4WNE4_GLYUR|nr:UDP-glycosyltransferase 73K3 [Glycyrrhiza uralensis]
METSTTRPLKIYFLPFFAQGHLIPLVNLARLVASRGQHVTIITTPSNAQTFENSISDDGAKIRVHIVNFPGKKLGLADGVENLFAASDNETAGKIHMAAHLIRPEIESLMKQNPPDVFIPDIMFTWSESTSKDLAIPRLVFNPISIFDVCMIEAIKKHPEAFESESGPYNIPGLPHPLTLPIKPSPGFARVTESIVEAEKGSHGVIVNSFAELDVGYTEYYENLTGRKVWHVGPTSLMVQKTKEETKATDSKKHECLSWLDTKQAGSVVYICFGSLCRLSDKQLLEIATGLEASKHQFLWVVHRKNDVVDNDNDTNKWLPEGFEEKMRKENRGMLIKGWAPQALILSHSAIGGFLTHCGWNALVEAISAGVPMITMPGFGDQYYNEKLVTEVHRFGVEVGAAEWSLSPYDAKKVVVGGERIEKAVKRLMGDGEIRERAKEMQEKAWRAVQEGGSSQNSLTALIDYLNMLVLVPKSAAAAAN